MSDDRKRAIWGGSWYFHSTFSIVRKTNWTPGWSQANYENFDKGLRLVRVGSALEMLTQAVTFHE